MREQEERSQSREERLRRRNGQRRRRRLQRKRAFRRRVRRAVCLAVWAAACVAVCLAASSALGLRLTGEPAHKERRTDLGISAEEQDGMPEISVQEIEPETAARETGSGEEEEQTQEALPEIDLTQLNSPCAVLADPASGKVLAEHNGQKRICPASLTKIMTALLVIEKLPDLQETVTLPTEMFSMLYLRHASLAGFEPEEQVSVKDLLYGILLPSGAECCIACAEKIAGSEEAFVELMNEKAARLGLSDTHFCNSTGLHEKKHYSTAEDMAVLLQYALQNEVFREVFCSRSYTTAATTAHPEGLTFESTMFQSLDADEAEKGRILGGKTGYTKEAGLCLASLGQIGGREYILVTAGAEGSHNTRPFHVLDAVKVYDWVEEGQG